MSDFFVFRILLGKDQIKKQNLEDTKMKDYSKMLNEEITWKSDAEILEFESKYKNYILNVLREKNIDEHSSQIIYDDILIKFSQGKLEYDSNIGKYEGEDIRFLYLVSCNIHSLTGGYHRISPEKQPDPFHLLVFQIIYIFS